MNTSTERVKRYRARQGERGLIHIELYVAPYLFDAMRRYGEVWETSVPDSLASLILSGLRAEGLLPAPAWFQEQMRKGFMKQFEEDDVARGLL